MTAKNKKNKQISDFKKLTAVALVIAVVGAGVAVTRLPYFIGENVVAVLDGDSFKIPITKP